MDDEKVVTTLSFNDRDTVLDETDQINQIEAPKSIERLEEISASRALERKLEEAEESDDESDILSISNEDIHLTDFEDLSRSAPTPTTGNLDNDVSLLGHIEEL